MMPEYCAFFAVSQNFDKMEKIRRFLLIFVGEGGRIGPATPWNSGSRPSNPGPKFQKNQTAKAMCMQFPLVLGRGTEMQRTSKAGLAFRRLPPGLSRNPPAPLRNPADRRESGARALSVTIGAWREFSRQEKLGFTWIY